MTALRNYVSSSLRITLAVAAVMLLIVITRSCFIEDDLHYAYSPTTMEGRYIVISRGTFSWCSFWYEGSTVAPAAFFWDYNTVEPNPTRSYSAVPRRATKEHSFAGVTYYSSPPTPPSMLGFEIPGETGFVLPLWYPFALLCIWPLLDIVLALLRRRRTLETACPICSYDLRAHHPGDKCPECGTLIPTKSATIIAEKGAPHDHS